MTGRPFRGTKFVPLAFEPEENFKLRKIQNLLSPKGRKPLVVFFTRKPLLFPDKSSLPIKPFIIKLPKKRIPDGPEFSAFKKAVFDQLTKRDKDSYIGVCSAHGKDLVFYVIARWIIEEKSLTVKSALDECTNHPPGIKKQKYIDSLSEIYGEDIAITQNLTIKQSTFLKVEQPQPSYQVPYATTADYTSYSSQNYSNTYYNPTPYYEIPQQQQQPYDAMTTGTPAYQSAFSNAPLPFDVSLTPKWSPSIHDQSPTFGYPTSIIPNSQATPNAQIIPNTQILTNPQIIQGPQAVPNPTIMQNSQIIPNPPILQDDFQAAVLASAPMDIPAGDAIGGDLEILDFDGARSPPPDEDNEDDIAIASIGTSVDQSEASELLKEVRSIAHVEGHKLFPQLVPWSSVTESIIARAEGTFNIMRHPRGRRVYVYVRSPSTYLIGNGGFVRSVKITLPDPETSQTLAYSLFEGVLSRSVDQGERARTLVLTDTLYFEGDSFLARPFADRVAKARHVCEARERLQRSGATVFSADDAAVEPRRNYRLKYLKHVLEEKDQTNTAKRGVVFASARRAWGAPLYIYGSQKPTCTVRTNIAGQATDSERTPMFRIVGEGTPEAGTLLTASYDFDSSTWYAWPCTDSKFADSSAMVNAAIAEARAGPITERSLIHTVARLTKLPAYVKEEEARQRYK